MKLSLQEAKNNLPIERKLDSPVSDDLELDKALANQCYSRHAEALLKAQAQLGNDVSSFQATSSKIQPLLDSTFDPSNKPFEGLVEVLGELYLGAQTGRAFAQGPPATHAFGPRLGTAARRRGRRARRAAAAARRLRAAARVRLLPARDARRARRRARAAAPIAAGGADGGGAVTKRDSGPSPSPQGP